MMPKTIKINGVKHAVMNAYSSGPGSAYHTFDLRHGAWVRQTGWTWRLHTPGQFPREVIVEIDPEHWVCRIEGNVATDCG